MRQTLAHRVSPVENILHCREVPFAACMSFSREVKEESSQLLCRKVNTKLFPTDFPLLLINLVLNIPIEEILPSATHEGSSWPHTNSNYTTPFPMITYYCTITGIPHMQFFKIHIIKNNRKYTISKLALGLMCDIIYCSLRFDKSAAISSSINTFKDATQKEKINF